MSETFSPDLSEEKKKKVNTGLLMVFTGHGKGKTTSAIGMALRAAGHGMKVGVIQFIKGKTDTGEAKALRMFKKQIDFKVTGRGFTWKAGSRQRHEEAAKEGWKAAKAMILSGDYQMVILDEFTYVLNYSMIESEKALSFLQKRPDNVHIIITGRDAGERLIEMADLVTEMKCIKHPFEKGIKAQMGVEF